ncbi:hypothetical protein DFJ73DRAFT_767546 [Zopfochytrium polystomum]|nr:hypothetical protein DFJ73DRAFT_767546 [Zopfochytrium polystomum]
MRFSQRLLFFVVVLAMLAAQVLAQGRHAASNRHDMAAASEHNEALHEKHRKEDARELKIAQTLGIPLKDVRILIHGTKSEKEAVAAQLKQAHEWEQVEKQLKELGFALRRRR